MLPARTLTKTVTRTNSCGLLLCNVGGFLLGFKASLTFLFFQSSPRTGTAATIALTGCWLLAVAAYTVLDPPQHQTTAVPFGLTVWINAYLALGGLSLLWTASGSVPVAAAYWAATVADVITIRLLLRYEPVQQNTVRIMHGFIAAAAVVAIIAWSAPAMDDMRLGNEDFLHPNLIGFEFAIAALFCAYLAQKEGSRPWTGACVGFVITTIRTLSKGTIVGFVFAGLYYVVRGLRVRRRVRIYIGLASTTLLLASWGLLEAYLDVYTKAGNVETLTGRTYIWSQALEFAMDRPWFGYGFDSFRWVFPPFEHFQPWQAHNEWLQQLFAYGIVGLFIVIAIYIAFYLLIRASLSEGLKSMATAILVLVLIRGLVDTDRFELCFPLWLMTMLSISLTSAAPSRYSV